jgi:3-oxoacyl-[acyl-carrier-protein] synthase III
MPIQFDHVYLNSWGFHLPGAPVSNDAMDAYIAPINRISARIKKRVLAENGIETRYYAIDANGNTVQSHSSMAAQAIGNCLSSTHTALAQVSLLSVGSSGGDALMPGFANMVQGELGAPPMQTLSSQGVCAAGVGAIEFAAQAIELGAHENALAVAVEMPSRMFKRSRFAPRNYETDFDAHFLRWMLSDGAGAVLLGRTPQAKNGLCIKLKWVHQKSFSGDYPVCMQLGLSEDRATSFLDYPSAAQAEAAGAMALRQDIRLLPHLFDVCIHEYVKLVQGGWVRSDQVDHFLCHYSSEKFMPVVEDLLNKAGLTIGREKWFSNLRTRGNTGAASIFIMLAEFLQTNTIQVGQKILCFIPESGRMTAGFMLFEVCDGALELARPNASLGAKLATVPAADPLTQNIQPPHQPDAGPLALQPMLTQLASLWQDYRSDVWRTPIVQHLVQRKFSVESYRRWTANWVPQVREGSKWMREAAASLQGEFAGLAQLIETHAGDEQNDFKILYTDYLAAGGTQALDDLKRNPGGEALNAYLHALANTPNPIGLLGAIYIIEGTGQRIVPALLPLLRQQVALPPQAFTFLQYHGANDENHLARWLSAVELVVALDPTAAHSIVATARRTAQLYLMQFDHI